MKEVVAEHLPKIRVTHRQFLERSSTVMLLLADGALPETGPVRQQLERYIGELPFTHFATELLSKNLFEKGKYDSSSEPLSLTEIPEHLDPKELANYLVDEFESLPWSYSLTIELGGDIGKLFAKSLPTFAISDFMRLITPNEKFAALFPLKSGVEAIDTSLGGGILGFLPPPKWNPESTYLQVDIEGFIGRYGDSATFEEVLALFKAFCGLGIALRLFKVKYIYRPIPAKAKFFVHRKVDGTWSIEKAIELDSSTSDTFNDLILDDLNEQLSTEKDKVVWMQKVLEDMACVFRNHHNSQKIILASQWLLDSCSGRNELLSFVQTVVAMEILLGEKAISDLLGLGELLRNRCAYLISGSHKQREEILSDFKKIYELRSCIVHRGKAKLTLNERSLFSKLQWMCRRVIQEEVNLLKQDISGQS